MLALRRLIVFLVQQGFSVFDLKSLYIDEFNSYYHETVYLLEQSGSLPEGSYDKATGIDRSADKLSQFFGTVKLRK